MSITKRFGAIAAAAVALSLTTGMSALPAQAAPVHVGTAAVKVAGHTVRGGIYTKWNANRAQLGNPLSGESCTNGVCTQRFQKGLIIWTVKTDGRIVLSDAIGERYAATGGSTGRLGYPTRDAGKLSVRGGTVQNFQKGYVYWSAATGAHSVFGGMKTFYEANKYERGFLGYPKSEEVAVPNGVRQDFEGGKLFYSKGKVFATTNGGVQTYYEQLGGAKSFLGLPTGNKVAWQGGYYQRFQGGVIAWGPATSSRAINTGHFDTMSKNFAKYGWPTKNTWTDAAGTHTQFQKATITTGAPVVAKPASAKPPVYPFSQVTASASSVVFYGDSQLDGDSWAEQAARAMGYTDHTSQLSYGGMGYSTANAKAGGTGWVAAQKGLIPFPSGTPGLVLVNLGGNDATSKKSDAQIIADSTALWAKLKLMYPKSKIVVNGVMSRSDASHDLRRHVDSVLASNAKKQGVTFISVAGLGSTANAEYRDNVHMTQAGHNAVAPLYTAKLKATLGK